MYEGISKMLSNSSSTDQIAIFGCGGHSSVVVEACKARGLTVTSYLVEKGFSASSLELSNHVVVLDYESPLCFDTVGAQQIALAIGENHARLRWCKRLLQLGFELPPLIHPIAWVSPSAILQPGTFIGAGAIVQACVHIGMAGLVNTSSVVEHHGDLGVGVHIAPGAILAGNVKVGHLALVGAGAVIRDHVAIGKEAVIGAGAVVIRDVDENSVVVGVPARKISPINQ